MGRKPKVYVSRRQLLGFGASVLATHAFVGSSTNGDGGNVSIGGMRTTVAPTADNVRIRFDPFGKTNPTAATGHPNEEGQRVIASELVSKGLSPLLAE